MAANRQVEPFQVQAATVDDLDGVVETMSVSWKDDIVFGAVEEKDLGALTRDIFRKDLGNQEIDKSFKVVETATGKLVGYGRLIYPKSTVETGDSKSQSTAAKEAPPAPDIAGLNPDMWRLFFGELTRTSSRFGYDPTKHFRRNGTFVHIDYQRKGLGKLLTAHLNQIADDAGASTFVTAREKSVKMFEAMDFNLIGRVHVDLSSIGRPEVIHPALRRDPGGKAVQAKVEDQYFKYEPATNT